MIENNSYLTTKNYCLISIRLKCNFVLWSSNPDVEQCTKDIWPQFCKWDATVCISFPRRRWDSFSEKCSCTATRFCWLLYDTWANKISCVILKPPPTQSISAVCSDPHWLKKAWNCFGPWVHRHNILLQMNSNFPELHCKENNWM